MGVEKDDDFRIGRDEGARRHVGSEHSGVIFSHSRSEEFFSALDVEVIVAIFDGSENGEAIAAGDGFQRQGNRCLF